MSMMSITRNTSTANLITMSAARWVIPLCLAAALASAYDVKTPTFTTLNPGIRIEYRDDGIVIDLVAFHFSVNKRVQGTKAGDYNVDVHRNKDGAFVYENRAVRLRPGDSVNYWVYVITNGLGYHRLEETWTVAGIPAAAATTKATTKATTESTTQSQFTTNRQPGHPVTPATTIPTGAISPSDPGITANQATSAPDNKGLGIALTAGIAIGAVVIVAIILVVFYVLLRRKHVRSQPSGGGSAVTSSKPRGPNRPGNRQITQEDNVAYIHGSTDELGPSFPNSDHHRYSYISIPETTYEQLQYVDHQPPTTYSDGQDSRGLYPTENIYPQLPDRDYERSKFKTGNEECSKLKATENTYQQLHVTSEHDMSNSNTGSQAYTGLNRTDQQQIDGDYETSKPENEEASHLIEADLTYESMSSDQMPQHPSSQTDTHNSHQSTDENVTVIQAANPNSNPGSPGYADLSISWSRFQEVVGGD